jgi:serine/threonine protein kinase
VEFEGYRILQKEGEYEGLQIFHAVAQGSQRHVQIRVFPAVLNRFPLLREQFQTTFDKLLNMQHTGICPLIGIGTQDNQRYIVLPYFVEGSLEDRFRSGFHSGLDINQVINEIATSMEFAHQNGVIHGNLTSDNVLIDEDGHVQIVGFGEAAILKALPSSGGYDKDKIEVVGPPEAEIASKLSARTDQYSLALIALRLLTGLPVEEAVEALNNDIGKVQRRISREGKYSLNLSGQVLQVINRALEEKPAKRYRSISEFTQTLLIALGFVSGPQNIPAQQSMRVTEYRTPRHKKRKVAIAPIVTLIAIFGVLITVALTQWIDIGGIVEPTEPTENSTYGIIELPDEYSRDIDQVGNSGFSRDLSTASAQPDDLAEDEQLSPTPAVVGSGAGSTSTPIPQPTRQITQSAPPTPSPKPPPSNTPTVLPPTNTPPPEVPTIHPPSCNPNPDHKKYCTPTP